MNRFVFIPALFAITLILASFTITTPSLIGQWKGEDGGEVGIITFDKEGYVSFTVNGEQVGGKDYESEGVVFDMIYETDETVTPHTMDFVIKMNEGDIEIARMEGIYAFADENTLIINMKFDGTERPTAMDEASPDQITLTKVVMKKGKKKRK